jgi:hypothetical protein
MTSSFKEGSGLIGKWITNKNTLEYIGIWEKINNSNFNYLEFGVIAQELGTNCFIMSAEQWVERTKLRQTERLQKLNNTAITQMQTLLNSKTLKALNK